MWNKAAVKRRLIRWILPPHLTFARSKQLIFSQSFRALKSLDEFCTKGGQLSCATQGRRCHLLNSIGRNIRASDKGCCQSAGHLLEHKDHRFVGELSRRLDARLELFFNSEQAFKSRRHIDKPKYIVDGKSLGKTFNNRRRV
jgi:hypothetical protein